MQKLISTKVNLKELNRKTVLTSQRETGQSSANIDISDHNRVNQAIN